VKERRQLVRENEVLRRAGETRLTVEWRKLCNEQLFDFYLFIAQYVRLMKPERCNDEHGMEKQEMDVMFWKTLR
jgi:hypothetical protein